MNKVSKTLAAMRNNPKNIRFEDLKLVCSQYFGKPRHDNGSHVIFKTPWPGDPRVNIQDNNGKAVPYQVGQVLTAIDKLEKLEGEE